MDKKLTVDDYLVPAQAAQAEIRVKGSRFIGTVLRVRTREDAEEQYDTLRKTYYSATHNCYAYRIDDRQFRYSDDGEPSGTAGKPILQAIDGKGVHEILCTVTRYFGGTKLGKGGLSRAYSDAASAAMEQTRWQVVRLNAEFTIRLNYDQEPLLRNILDRFEGRLLDSIYSDDITLVVAVPRSRASDFTGHLSDATRSSVKIVAS